MKQLRKWYKSAYEKFKIEEEYSENKTKQDFISDMKNHLSSNIKDGKIIYEDKETDISNIKIEWEYRIEEKEDIIRLNNFSILISAITIVAAMTTTTFLANTQIIFGYKIILLLALSAIFYFILFAISMVEKYSNMNTNYDSSFYQICLKILEDLEQKEKEKSIYRDEILHKALQNADNVLNTCNENLKQAQIVMKELGNKKKLNT